MNPETQRIAIAEACGFAITLPHLDCEGDMVPASAIYPASWCGPDLWPWLPHFTTDLNAMHAAEKVLTDAQFEEYRIELYHICGPCDIVATAAQRAEAFLRTIGKWQETNHR